MFDPKSRYAKAELYHVTDRRGRIVQVVTALEAPDPVVIGFHLLLQGQRIDHLAKKYLGDDAGFWRICEANGVMQAEMLSEAPEIAIPERTR